MNIPERESKDLFGSSNYVTELKPKDFENVATWRLKSKECCIILFYAPWCPHCQKQVTMWNDLAAKAAFFNVCSYNCEKNMSHLSKMKEDMPDLIHGYPTFIIYEKGEPVEKVGEQESQRNVAYFLKACMRACK